MLAASIAIVIVLQLMSFLFLRDKKFDYMKSSLILAIVPLSHLLSFALSRPLSVIKGVVRGDVIVIGLVAGLMLSCILLGLMSFKIKRHRLKVTYLVVNGLFVGILSLIFIYNVTSINFH